MTTNNVFLDAGVWVHKRWLASVQCFIQTTGPATRHAATPEREMSAVFLYNKCKKLQFIHKLTSSDTSKTAKITKK